MSVLYRFNFYAMKRTKFSCGITRYWWLPLIYGLVCIGLGIWTLLSPAESLPVLAYAFATGMILAAIIDFVLAGVGGRYNSQWGWSLALGIMEMIGGIWLVSLPETELTVTFMIIVGIWILVASINSVVETLTLSAFSAGWLVWSILLLVATAVLAIFFLSTPTLGGIAVWLWIGLMLICYGTFRLVLALRIKTLCDFTDGMI